MVKRLKLKTNIIKEEYYTISSKELAKELGIKLKDDQYLDCQNILNSDDIIIYIKDNEVDDYDDYDAEAHESFYP